MWQLYTLNNKDKVDQKAFVPFTYFLSTYFYNLVMSHTHQEYELQIKSIYWHLTYIFCYFHLLCYMRLIELHLHQLIYYHYHQYCLISIILGSILINKGYEPIINKKWWFIVFVLKNSSLLKIRLFLLRLQIHWILLQLTRHGLIVRWWVKAIRWIRYF